MAKHRLLFIFSLLYASMSLAQTETTDSTQVQTVRTVIPSLYIDITKLITIPTTFETKYEGGLELLFQEKFPLILEVGKATLTPEGAYANGTYESDGMYYRLGAGYVGALNPKNKIGISARYAIASFNETGRISIKSPTSSQKDVNQDISYPNLKANWYEVVVYSDKKLSELFSIGLNLRLRILGSYDKQEPVDVYAIPGYGRSFDKTTPAANFFLKVNF